MTGAVDFSLVCAEKEVFPGWCRTEDHCSKGWYVPWLQAHNRDTRPGQQLEAAQRQDADLCKLINAKVVTLYTILLGVSGTCYTEHTLEQFKQLGLDYLRANKLARKLHAHSVMYANKLVTTRRAIENKDTSRSQVIELGASSNPPGPH
eukprot:1161401-Pelagomonas_calceolata.AAC.18